MRLLAAQASVGIVLGKRGATVSQLRQETGASIKVVPSDAMPAAYGGSLGGDDSEAGGWGAHVGRWQWWRRLGTSSGRLQGCLQLE